MFYYNYKCANMIDVI